MFDDCHGGALATYIDIATTTGLYAFDLKGRTHVSAKLDIEYISAGKTSSKDFPAQVVLIDAQVNKIGKNLAFTECRMFYEETNAIICTGTHLKAFTN